MENFPHSVTHQIAEKSLGMAYSRKNWLIPKWIKGCVPQEQEGTGDDKGNKGSQP